MANWKSLRRSLIGDNPASCLPPRVKLPVLPHAALEFSKKSQDPNVAVEELGDIIETDSGLTCDLLRHVNSSAFGLRRKISSAKHAVVALSVHQCRLFLLENCLEKAFKQYRSEFIDPWEFAAVNLERALFAQEVAILFKADTSLAFTAGMLVDFVLPMVTLHLGHAYSKYVDLPDDEQTSLAKFEEANLGWDHAHAAAQVMLQWGFPDDLICCVLLHHRGFSLIGDKVLSGTAANAVAIASCLPDPLNQTPHGLDMLIELDRRWEKFDLKAISEKVSVQYEEMKSPQTEHKPIFHQLRTRELSRS
jgi:HD-like signal output (HDOD) protein